MEAYGGRGTSVRTIICDLARDQLVATGTPFDEAICREELLAASDCLGCFGCWVRTPGACVVPDALGELPSLLARTDELWLFSANAFGGLSPLVKRALDRSIGYLHPGFRVTGNELHHRMRAERALSLRVWLYGPSTAAERACLGRIAAANAVNLGARLEAVRFPTGWRGAGGEKDGPVAQTPGTRANRADALPRRVALVNASPRGAGSATAHLLGDLAEALAVYARRARMEAPELVDVPCPRAGAAGAEGLAGCDAVLLGYPLHVDALPSGLVDLLVRWQGSVTPRTRVYALANMGFFEPEQILPSFSVIENFCAATGARWMGGVAVGGGGMTLATAGSPRMGMLRRPVSEAVDRLIAAIRSGTAAGEDLVRPAVPRAIYRLAAEAHWRRLARESGANLDAAPWL